VLASKEPASLSEESREETSASATVDVAELNLWYCDLPSYQPEPAGDSMVAEETRATLPSTEPITFPVESVGEMTAVSLTSPVLATTGLRVITSLISPTLVVESAFSGVVTSPTSVVAGVLDQ